MIFLIVSGDIYSIYRIHSYRYGCILPFFFATLRAKYCRVRRVVKYSTSVGASVICTYDLLDTSVPLIRMRIFIQSIPC